MPLICFLTALALGLETPYALGLLIIGCCPGGTVSNLFTFWTNGDVCLRYGHVVVDEDGDVATDDDGDDAMVVVMVVMGVVMVMMKMIMIMMMILYSG